MSYIALYRKFRPDNFEDVKGQEAVVTTLKNQVRKGRIGHAYLFCGTRGTGKTTAAKILARAVNCENPKDGSPCGECAMCRAIKAGTSMNVIEIDAASNNGVDNIREIREEVAYRPTEGNYKVYIIDEVHMLSAGAFNALLKTLEEPPAYVIFILATTEVNKIPVTILSRCQRYDFKRISLDTISSRLSELLEKEGVEAEEKAVRYIARAGDGSMRDALSLLDQCISFYIDEKLTYDNVLKVLGAVDTEVFSRLLRKILRGDASSAVRILEEMIAGGKELTVFVSDFTWYLRNLLLVKTSADPSEAVDLSSENLKLLMEEKDMADMDTLMRYIRVLSELSGQIRYSAQKRVLTEIALIRLCRPEMETRTDALLDRIRVLEEKIEEIEQNGIAVKAGRTPAGDAGEAQEEHMPEEQPRQAAPEDLKKIAAQWPSVIRETQGIFREILKNSEPRYDGRTGSPVLFVVFRGFIARNYVDNPEYASVLQKIILEKTGKTAEVKLVMQEDAKGTGLSTIPVETKIRENVHFDVVTEEDDEEE